ncbi:atp-dependent rna helicase dhx8 [Diplodia corticola]|uniref:Atp-dependent rna helicase dhx8 n=1 Tax=Diplodia corticola TaxID=236234 RepID=A0A1J9QZW0_9PEZI|nr:atp-dependent rna helicase dhx8 [Diplodia corticola]OJD33920.1 atp-dependent rna helicase dhx8 [Diplodia corticola]
MTTTTTTTPIPPVPPVTTLQPSPPPPHPPQRQIRALYDSTTITVYQAYPSAIADAAVATQRLSASPAFKPGRMTWIKPSWCWMMYRSGYALKDARQERVLALRVTHEGFAALLRRGVLTHEVGANERKEKKEGAGGGVRVQWDPERSPRLERCAWRSLQVGIPPGLVQRWVDEWVVGIEDVTARARGLKEAVEGEGEAVDDAELRRRGLLPDERVYVLPADVAAVVGVDG